MEGQAGIVSSAGAGPIFTPTPLTCSFTVIVAVMTMHDCLRIGQFPIRCTGSHGQQSPHWW